MSFNILKKYNELLDIRGLSVTDRKKSLWQIFDRDFIAGSQPIFNGKNIEPIPKVGQETMEVLFHHLTTTIVDKKIRKRDMDLLRAERLHWIVHHFKKYKNLPLDVFSTKDKDGIRTYIYDDTEKYVIVLEPFRNRNAYYLLTAYHLTGRNKNKIKSKIRRKLNQLY